MKTSNNTRTLLNKATKIRHIQLDVQNTDFMLLIDLGEAVPITKVDKTVTIQYPEKGIRVLTQSLPFPDGKLSPEEDKDSSKVIQQVRGRDRIQLKSCLLGLFLSSRVFPPGQEEKTKHPTLHFRGKWRQAGKGVTDRAHPTQLIPLGGGHCFLRRGTADNTVSSMRIQPF